MTIDPKVLKQVRKALGLSQQELADALQLSRVTVNKMERGKLARGIPDEIGERLMGLKPGQEVKPRRDMLCRHCGSVLSAVTFTCVRGEYCPGAKDDNHLWDNGEDDQ